MSASKTLNDISQQIRFNKTHIRIMGLAENPAHCCFLFVIWLGSFCQFDNPIRF